MNLRGECFFKTTSTQTIQMIRKNHLGSESELSISGTKHLGEGLSLLCESIDCFSSFSSQEMISPVWF